jgi:hypothetical protein
MRFRYTRGVGPTHVSVRPYFAVAVALIGLLATHPAIVQAAQSSAKPSPSVDPAESSQTEAPAQFVGPYAGETPSKDGSVPQLTPGLCGPPVDKFDYDTNPAILGGRRSVPPDPYVAAGPDHTINVGNLLIEWQRKDNPGVSEHLGGLGAFFAAAPGYLGTFTFDPKVIYDQYAGRFVVVTLERLDVTGGAATNESRIHIAVSKTPDPNLGWWFHSIDTKLVYVDPYGGGVCEFWADYPGLGLDDKGVYVTANMFGFGNQPCGYGGGRLWIIHKGPTYAGPNGSIAVTVHDALSASGLTPGQFVTQQAAHMFGVPPVGSTGKPLGTYLTGYDGFTDCATEYVVTIEVTDPLGGVGGPFFVSQIVPTGNLENLGCATGWPNLPDAPQAGFGPGPGFFNFPIEVNDRRTMNAVWRDNCLFTCAPIMPLPGDPDAGQTTAHWWRIDTTVPGALAVVDQGNVGAEDLGAGTFTFMPQVMVDCNKNMAMGFAASNAAGFCGAYYATRLSTDPPGFIGATGTLQAGVDYYHRFHGGSRNRWGDYSGLALCPVDEATFWIYNEYAGPRGTPGVGFNGNEDGRWKTKLGCFRIKDLPVAVAITSFDARVKERGVVIEGTFASSLALDRVNLYRADGDAALRRLSTHAAETDGFSYFDGDVRPGGTYRYQIGVVDAEGEFLSPVERVSIPAARFALGQNKPNPFNPSTTIDFSLASREHVTMTVYDAAGRMVAKLVDGIRDAGQHQVEWNGRDSAGHAVGSGTYFYRLDAGTIVESKKMILLK